MFQKYNIILNNCKLLKFYTRFLSVRIIEKPRTLKDISERHAQKLILQDELGLRYVSAAKLIRENKYLLAVKNQRLLDTIQILKKMGITPEDIYKNPTILNVLQHTIEHNIMYLKEAGFKDVTASILIKFRTIVKRPISLLKAHGLIAEEINVVQKLNSYLYMSPIDLTTLKHLTDEDSIVRVHEVLLKKYFEWRLELCEKDLERIFRIYDGFKYKSFQLTLEMIDILINQFGFPIKKIVKHSYLLAANPRAVSKFCTSIPTLAEIKIAEVLYKHPKLMTVSVENVRIILKHIRDFGISDEAIQKCFDVFTLAPDSVLYRLNELNKVPEFEALIKNQRILLLLLFQNKAKLRLQILRNLNVKCASLHILCAADSVFDKYTQDGNDRTKGSDIINYLSVEFGQPLKVIRYNLSINLHWYHVPLLSIQNSLRFLTKEGFTIDDIKHSPVILLYPIDQLKDTLKEIENNSELSEKTLTAKQRLNVCLYLIERKHHFSGDGLWLCTEKQKPIV